MMEIIGHRAPTHLVNLYQQSLNLVHRGPQGNYMEVKEDIAQYTNTQSMPEVHIVSHNKNPADSLEGPTMCIVDNGTSHTI